jgi:hypothetical protein
VIPLRFLSTSEALPSTKAISSLTSYHFNMASSAEIKTEFKDEPRDSQEDGGDDEVCSCLRFSILSSVFPPSLTPDLGRDRSHEAPCGRDGI